MQIGEYKLYNEKLLWCKGRKMSTRLKNKVVLLIGASKGIGRGIATLFATEGAQLMLVGRNESLLESLIKEINNKGGQSDYCLGDVANEQDMENAAKLTVSRFGKLDILCQNAGIYPEAWIEQMTAEQWHQVLNTNLTGTFYAVKACIPYLKKQNGGRIVLTSSISGPQVGLPGYSHYTASKGGMNGFIRTIAIELAKYNITVNGIEPGNIITEGMADLGEEHIKRMERAIPLRRLGSIEDIAHAMLFLASDEASYITGQTIVVDGGQILPESHFLPFYTEQDA